MNDQPQLPDEFKEWRQHPFTQRFFQFLFLRREKNKEDWAKETFVGVDLQSWAIQNATALGGVRVLDQLLELDMTDINDAEKGAHEYIRNHGSRLDGAG